MIWKKRYFIHIKNAEKIRSITRRYIIFPRSTTFLIFCFGIEIILLEQVFNKKCTSQKHYFCLLQKQTVTIWTFKFFSFFYPMTKHKYLNKNNSKESTSPYVDFNNSSEVFGKRESNNSTLSSGCGNRYWAPIFIVEITRSMMVLLSFALSRRLNSVSRSGFCLSPRTSREHVTSSTANIKWLDNKRNVLQRYSSEKLWTKN